MLKNTNLWNIKFIQIVQAISVFKRIAISSAFFSIRLKMKMLAINVASFETL